MKSLLILTAMMLVFACGHAHAQDVDQELSVLAEKLAGQIKEQGKKKVTVVDFTDLNGSSTELGKYIAEQLTVNFVVGKRDFSVLDRANLKSILAEHKLTSQGLVDPENAKKLGQFAGVDTLILGTIIPKNQKMTLTAKIITTDTAEIIGAGRVEFKTDDTVQQLVSRPASDSKAASSQDEKPKFTKSFKDLRVEVQSLKIVDGNQFLLTMTLTNQSPKKTIWVALSTDLGNNPKANITDSDGVEFQSGWNGIVGVAYAAQQHDGFFKATEIRPRDSTTATVKFVSRSRRGTSPGQCSLQVEFLLGYDFDGSFGQCVAYNLTGKIEAQ
jgi:TolB-like protein